MPGHRPISLVYRGPDDVCGAQVRALELQMVFSIWRRDTVVLMLDVFVVEVDPLRAVVEADQFEHVVLDLGIGRGVRNEPLVFVFLLQLYLCFNAIVFNHAHAPRRLVEGILDD